MFLIKPKHLTVLQEKSVLAQCSDSQKEPLLHSCEWKYVAEGGANVLFRHTATYEGHYFHGKILRVKKCDITSISQTQPAHYPNPKKVLEYAQKDLMPFMSGSRTTYLQVAQLIQVNQQFLIELNQQLMDSSSRPQHRRTSQIDVSLDCAMLLPDVSVSSDLNTMQDGALSAPIASKSIHVARSSASLGLGDQQGQQSSQIYDSVLDTCFILTPTSSTSVTSLDVNSDDINSGEEFSAIDDQRLEIVASNCKENCALSHSVPTGSIFDCCFRNICIEIKPKIGFKPRGDDRFLPKIKTRVCRFCMHQQYKRAMGKIDEVSAYCPLDLFSGNYDRVRKALCALQSTPQNNFRAFVRSSEGEVVNAITGMNADALPKGASRASYSCHRKRLGYRHSCHSIGTEAEAESSKFGTEEHVIFDLVELLADVLLGHTVLNDLKEMQMLDHINVDGMWHFQKFLERIHTFTAEKEFAKDLENANLEVILNEMEKSGTDDDTVTRFLTILEYAMLVLKDYDRKVLEGVTKWESMSIGILDRLYQHLLQRFEVAATLKDCSLLFYLRRIDDDRSTHTSHLQGFQHVICHRGMRFNCVMAVVDLDVKSHKSVDAYYANRRGTAHSINIKGEFKRAQKRMLSIFTGVLSFVAFTIAFFGSERIFKWRRPLKDYEVFQLTLPSASIYIHFQAFMGNVWWTCVMLWSKSFSRDEFYGIGGQDMDMCKVTSGPSNLDSKMNVMYNRIVYSISRATAEASIRDGLLRVPAHLHKGSKSMKPTIPHKLKPKLSPPRVDTFMQAA
ncbi:unnamed protein product [Albugo candida]|uniref:inositol-pentakisphosphate 2-kinase n=1 Tax=Albugo candida TaxID=65357 RepID=A0A024GE57_9STRA|nr:unnamed protein product [Albugo candida]|eukprot:CCI44944.1 unnamed protein product [Albugo candida]